MKLHAVMPNRPAVQRYQSPYAPAFGAAAAPAPETPVNSIAFFIGCIYTFLLFSRASEFIDNHGRMHLVIIFGLLGIVALISTGNILKMILTPQGQWLGLFTCWLLFGLPFSMWKGGSVGAFKDVWLKSFIAFFLVGGLLFTVEHIRKLLFFLGIGTIAIIYFAFHAGRAASDDRLSVTYGTLGNANDLAAALLIGLPILLYSVTDKKRNALFRLGFLAACGVLLMVVLKTGSRGGLLAIAVLGLIAFFKSSGANKAKLIALGAVLAVAFPFVVSNDLRARYKTIFSQKVDGGTSENVGSAIASSNARRELMKHGFVLMGRHPVFGVGLGQFAVQSANLFIEKGEPPLWFTSHDIFLLVGAETGVLGLIFYCGVMLVCFKSQLRLSKAARIDPSLSDISRIAFCLFVCMTAFTFCGIFGTDAYNFEMPLLAALTAALERVSAPRIAAVLAARAAKAPVAPPAFANHRMPQRTLAVR